VQVIGVEWRGGEKGGVGIRKEGEGGERIDGSEGTKG